MTIKIILLDVIIIGVIIFYFAFTLRYFFEFKKNLIFTGKVKIFHLIMIWVIPFLWILVLKSLTKDTPGSYEIEDKSNTKPFSDNDTDAIKASNMGF